MNRASLRRTAGLLGFAVAALSACSEQSPVTPNAGPPSFGSIPGGTGTPTTSTPSGELFKVCKVYRGTVGPDVTVRVQVDEGNNGPGAGDEDFNVLVGDGECVAVWTTGENAGSTDLVTVTETVPGGYASSTVKATVEDGVVTTGSSTPGASASNTITNPGGTGTDGVVVTFFNELIPSDGCTLTQGYWKTHASGRKDAWPVATLTIGGILYTKAELVAIMEAPTAGNGLMSLVQQLIAAKLNVIEGASSVDIADEIAAADAMIDAAGGKIALGPPSSPFIDPATSSSLNNALTAFNEGNAGVPHCED